MVAPAVEAEVLGLAAPLDVAAALNVLRDTPGATFVVDVEKLSGFDGDPEPPPICSLKELSADGSSRIVSSGEGVTLLVGVSDDPVAVVAVVDVSGAVFCVVGLTGCGTVALGSVDAFGSFADCAEAALVQINDTSTKQIASFDTADALYWIFYDTSRNVAQRQKFRTLMKIGQSVGYLASPPIHGICNGRYGTCLSWCWSLLVIAPKGSTL